MTVEPTYNYLFSTRASVRLPSDQATLQRINIVCSDAAVMNTLLVSATNDTSYTIHIIITLSSSQPALIPLPIPARSLCSSNTNRSVFQDLTGRGCSLLMSRSFTCPPLGLEKRSLDVLFRVNNNNNKTETD